MLFRDGNLYHERNSCTAPAGGEKRKRPLENGATKQAAAKKSRADGDSAPKREAKPAKKKPKQEVRHTEQLVCALWAK